MRKYVSAGCFLRSCRKNGWKIQGISHKCCRQDEVWNRRNALTDMQGMCRNIPEKSCLTSGEKDAFFSLGEHLGYLDLEMQMKQLSLYEENLEEEISRLKEEASVKKRLYRSLGILGGLLLAVLLI